MDDLEMEEFVMFGFFVFFDGFSLWERVGIDKCWVWCLRVK